MSRFGKCGEYRGFPCPNCGRYRLVHYSKGFDICEKCDWCVELGEYVDTSEPLNYDDGDGDNGQHS